MLLSLLSLKSPFSYIMVPPPSIKSLKDLPVHLIHQKILPRLPFKYLNRYKCISKEIHSLISTDAEFAAEQSRSADTSSNGLVYMTRGRLSFFSHMALVGVPDPSLDFLNPIPHSISLISSTNGLLLLFGQFSSKVSFCVCNPATKDTVFIPKNKVVGKKSSSIGMGLVYDPCELPGQFTIVDLVLDKQSGDLIYQLDVFRSDTGKWTRSSQGRYIDTILKVTQTLCAKGVIYWCCGKYLLWYNAKRDIVGSLLLPVIEGKVIKGATNIGIYAGEITCCRAWSGGIEVWSLTGGSHWDKIHAASWDGMVDALDFCLGMQLRHKSLSDIFYKRRIVRPLGFDGKFVYIAVRMKYEDKTEKLFSWETETGRVENKGVITIIDQVFNYANSMARVPQIFNVTS